MIPLIPDPDDMPRSMPPEHCCFCGRPTRMWFGPKDVAVCTGCAETREPEEVPSKDEWWDSPQAQGQRVELPRPNVPEDLGANPAPG